MTIFISMVVDEIDETVGDEAPTTMQDEDVAVYETSSFLSRILFVCSLKMLAFSSRDCSRGL